MTKIGEGNQPHPQKSQEIYQMQLQQGVNRFQSALESYSIATENDQKLYLKETMTQQLALIKSSISEIHRSGIEKQGSKIESDYRKYITAPTTENYTALEQDLSTLKEYGSLPTIG